MPMHECVSVSVKQVWWFIRHLDTNKVEVTNTIGCVFAWRSNAYACSLGAWRCGYYHSKFSFTVGDLISGSVRIESSHNWAVALARSSTLSHVEVHYMMAVSERSLVHWRYFDMELLSYHEGQDGHHLEEGTSLAADGNILLFSISCFLFLLLRFT